MSAASVPEFPWPPPPPSAQRVIPAEVLLERMREAAGQEGQAPNKTFTLRDLDGVLSSALTSAGYERSYFGAPDGGFALVTRMERTTASGAPDPQQRFDPGFRPLPAFSLDGYLRALFTAPPGYYRIVVFVVSPRPFATTGAPVSADEATAWLEKGLNVLPPVIGRRPYSSAYATTALIYEFEKRDAQSNPTERHPGRLSADAHLTGSGIRGGLWKTAP